MSHHHGMLRELDKLQLVLLPLDNPVFGRVLPHNPIRLPADLNRARELLGRLAASMKSNKDPDGDAAAGLTFFGQFIDHDITLDVTSELGKVDLPGFSGEAFTL